MKLKDALSNCLSEREQNLLIKSFDIVGDIAITIIPPELEKYETAIGEAILRSNNKLKVVARRNGRYSGTYRTIPLKIIAGENRKETECREFGVRLLVNPENVYYSIRSANERKRIADQVAPGEKILVMFSGIGVYPLILSKHSSANHITGIELNRDAHNFGMKNISLNKSKNISLYHGDVSDIVPSLSDTFDRIIMPLPQKGRLFLSLAFPVLQPRGMLHLYDFQQKNSFRQSIDYLNEQCIHNQRILSNASVHKCGHPSPDTYRICVDSCIG